MPRLATAAKGAAADHRIFNDNKDQLERRIARLETGMARAEEPPSRTRHLISNLQVSETDVPDVFRARLNYLLSRAQKSGMKPYTLACAWTKYAACRAMSGVYWSVDRAGSGGDLLP